MNLETRECEVFSCGRSTREGKPFCPGHLTKAPYVQEILRTLAEIEAEAQDIERRGPDAVTEGSLLLEEFMIRLMERMGAASIDRLARDLSRDPVIVKSLALYLVRKDQVVVGRSSRGTIMVKVVARESNT